MTSPTTTVVVTSVAPATLTAGAPATTLTIAGSGFTSATAVQVGSVVEQTTFVSSTQVTASVPASQLASGSVLAVIAENGSATSGSGTPVNLTVTNPSPAITGFAPSAFLAGSTSLTVAVTGSGFVPSTGLQVSGSPRATAFVSSTQVNVTLTAADLANSGAVMLTAVNPAPGGGTSVAASVAVNNPAPAISALTPATLPAGATVPTTVTVSGSGFLPASQVQIGGTNRPTTYISATQLTFTLTVADQASAASLGVAVANPAPGGGTSGPVALAVQNPAPAVTALNPATLLAGGSAAATITLTGSGFVPSSQVQVNGSNRLTTYVSATQLTFQLTVADQASAASLPVVVTNPSPGGGSSAAVALPVSNPAPVLTTLNPATVAVGGTSALTVTVTGTGFTAASQVQVGGANRTTSFVSSTQLTFQLTAADQAQVGPLSVTVSNAAPGGGNSAPLIFTVALATRTPVISQTSPASFTAGSAATTITVTGTNLTATSIVQWNGVALQTQSAQSNLGALYLMGAVPANLLATAGTATITVDAPTANPGISNAVSVTIVNPPAPRITSVSASAIPINTATAVTLSGTGFTAASSVAVNGTTIASTFSTGQLKVILPAGTLTLLGANSLTVTTPAPGGGTTAPYALTAYVGLVNNSMVFNAVNGLFYLSIPSSAGAPYGNSVVSVDPNTGAIGTPIPVGSEPNKLAISSDGTILWVGLDGASAVRQVNLTSGTAGLQFTLGGNSGLYAPPSTALALAALPGAPNSVVVASTVSDFNTGQLGIYDSGVLRGQSITASITQTFDALQINGARSELYAGGTTYGTYTYAANGLTLKSASTSANTFASYSADEMQLANGILYSDFGQASDAESGALLGTFYATGTTVADGPVVADTTLGKVFILDNASGPIYSGSNQIQIFNLADYTATGAVIPVTPLSSLSSGTVNTGPSRLTRWGTNGLAFRTGVGLFSLQSNLVKDLSTTNADLSVGLVATGAATTGTNTTYSATVTDQGPSGSTSVALTGAVPSTGVLLSAVPSQGSCSLSNGVSCDLGSIPSGASVTVVFVVQQTTAGTATMIVHASGAENDPAPANNMATATNAITGGIYNVLPAISSISPNAIQTGSSGTTLTVTGVGFGSSATVQLGSTPLATSFVSSTQLTATVPSAQVASLGWAPVTVANPAPGGGTSNAVPLSFFSVITLGANHLVYDPFSRNIMASVGSGSTTVTGNSIVAITPDTATVGTAVPIGSQPTYLSLTSDGQILYTILSGSQSIARFNMLTQQPDYTYVVPSNTSFVGGIALRGIAAQPGTENTVALDIASFTGNAIYDFNPANKTAAIRGQASGPYSGSCLTFLDASDLLAFDVDTSGATFDHYMVTSAGFTYYNYSQYTESTLDHFGCFKLSGGLAFANAGGVANPATSPATQIGIFPVSGGGEFSTNTSFAPDTSLQRAFYLVNTAEATGNTSYVSAPDGIQVFNQNTFLPSSSVYLNMETIEGNTSYTGVDVVRWGQDGLAVLTSGGHIYLLRGAVVAPQELQANSAATLTGSSTATIPHGTGNTVVTLTGSNFVPGVAVTWNGAYRTTTIVDATHVTVAIPASDLGVVGAGALVATNPGAAASGSLTVTIN